ncbi:MAG: hypothetical protein IJP70_01645 [Bacteroidales bacterium]|nr:hypothetical protein [Bacteroidales bacterium]
MKKTYIAPTTTMVAISTDNRIMVGSNVSGLDDFDGYKGNGSASDEADGSRVRLWGDD